MADIKKLFRQIDEAQLMVVSTVHGDEPQSAVVALTPQADNTIAFATSDTTREFENLSKNPKVSLVIGWDGWSVQLEGTVRVTAGAEAADIKAAHFKRNPQAAHFADDPTQRYMIVTPNWARLTDFRGEETVIEEFKAADFQSS